MAVNQVLNIQSTNKCFHHFVVVRCPYLQTPENGNKLVSGHSVGDNATFWCNPPHAMLCSDCFLRICKDDGTWSGSVAVCAEKISMFLSYILTD